MLNEYLMHTHALQGRVLLLRDGFLQRNRYTRAIDEVLQQPCCTSCKKRLPNKRAATDWRLEMKKFLLGSVAVAALSVALGAGAANAADMAARPYMKAPPAPMAPIYNWTGFYIGGHVGGAWVGDNNIQSDGGRFLGGVQGGADYQFAPNWVIGIEAQYSWLTNSDNNGTAFPGPGVVTRDTRGLGSVTGRVGWTWGPGLLYVKGGYAFTDTSIGVTVAGVPQAFGVTGNDKSGYTVGAGLEYMLAPNWSLKGEYQYFNFGNTTFVATTPAAVGLLGASFHNDEHTVKLGLNYRFGGWSAPGRY